MTIRPILFALLLVIAGAIGGGTVLAVQSLAGAAPDDGVRAYLLANPEVLPEAMRKLQDRENGKLIGAHRSAIEAPFPGAVGGNPKGDVSVVAFMDYACGYCRASLPELAKLVTGDASVRIVYRELPILSEASGRAAQWSLAAAEQGRFLPFHEALYAAGPLSDATIAQAASRAGLDMPRATRVAASPAVAAEIARNIDLARALGVSATPTWVVGDRLLSGQPTEATLAEAVKAARNKS